MGLFGPPDVSQLKTKKNVKGLIKALEYQKDWRVRELAARALGELGAVEAVDALINKLKDFSEVVENTAADALVEIGKPAIDDLVSALADPDRREYVAHVLVDIGGDAIPALSEVVEKGWFMNARKYAAWTLGKIGDSSAVDALLKGVLDEDPHVRKAAAQAMLEIGEEAIEQLNAALKNDDKKIRQAAEWALSSFEE
ncbi:MAG: HEAT repeat domain-containing protein [Calditrichia bacterium]